MKFQISFINNYINKFIFLYFIFLDINFIYLLF